MYHYANLTLLHQMQAMSDIDRALALDYLTFIGDQLMLLELNHFAQYRQDNYLDLDTYWTTAASAAVGDVLAVFSRTDAAEQVERMRALWTGWGSDFKSRLFVANVPDSDVLRKEIDDFVGVLDAARDRVVIAISSNDDEKRQFMRPMWRPVDLSCAKTPRVTGTFLFRYTKKYEDRRLFEQRSCQ